MKRILFSLFLVSLLQMHATKNTITVQPGVTTCYPDSTLGNLTLALGATNLAVLGHGTKRDEFCGSGKVIATAGICITCSSLLASHCMCNAMNIPQEDATTRNCAFTLVDFALLKGAKEVQRRIKTKQD